jgi:hypothetical protein
MKKQSKIYEYLESTGLLSNGSDKEISLAKAKYWESVRREYKKNRYKEQKSYTVFFTKQELNLIVPKSTKNSGGIVGYIKHSTISNATGKLKTDKHILGQIRESIFKQYFIINTMVENNKQLKEKKEELFAELKNIENIIYQLL